MKMTLAMMGRLEIAYSVLEICLADEVFSFTY